MPRGPQSLISPPERPLDGLEGCMFAKKLWAIIICTLQSPIQSSLPFSVLINFWLHISLEEKKNQSINTQTSLLFLLGVNRWQWNYSFGLLNTMESQCLMSKVWNESVNAVAMWRHYCIVFQSEPNSAWQIFVLVRVCGCVFDCSFLNSRLHLINHF